MQNSPSSSLLLEWISGDESDWDDENSSFHFFRFFGGGSAFTLACLTLGFVEGAFVDVVFVVGGSEVLLLLLGLAWTVLQCYKQTSLTHWNFVKLNNSEKLESLGKKVLTTIPRHQQNKVEVSILIFMRSSGNIFFNDWHSIFNYFPSQSSSSFLNWFSKEYPGYTLCTWPVGLRKYCDKP